MSYVLKLKNGIFQVSSCLVIIFLLFFQGCSQEPGPELILTNGKVYTLSWDEPAPDGTPASNAPYSSDGWQPDAEALVIGSGQILFVGSTEDALNYPNERVIEANQIANQDESVKVIDVNGATILPGLVDSHTHVTNLGKALSILNLVGVETEEEAVAKAVEWAKNIPRGEWVIGRGWDEGAWANRYPDMKLLSEKIPDHPVCLRGLHSFAVWGNKMAFEKAGITSETKAPKGGEIRKDANGNLTGILINNATDLLETAIPGSTPEQIKQQLLAGLNAMAEAGYVAVHDAGVRREMMDALQILDDEGKLPIRIYAMLSARDESFMPEWLLMGPRTNPGNKLIVRSVKAYYDGALGSRGARLLQDYSDKPGHRGVSGNEYGFDEDIIASMMIRGFQVAIHAIGDAGNREALDFLETVINENPSVKSNRHRIEHAQVIHPDDFKRFIELGLIASMEPPHAVEDKTWAEDRLGSERVKGAYAWRTLREIGVRLTFNSDLPGSDHNIFYGLHAAMTRRGKDKQPTEGWYPEQNMTPEEAIRGYTNWSAYAAFLENETGILEPGRWADITVMDIDPFVLGETDPGKILDGEILMTIVNGIVIYEKK
ncbi:amidohydrolase [candidate division KSB1 bacterium]|nr:amidohydrolase [candidate division KSB1 bacterium]